MLQVAGLRATYDMARVPGQRLLSVFVDADGGALQSDRMYKIVASSFVALRGDHYASFMKGKNVHDTGKLLCDVLSDYGGKMKALAAEPQGRMVEVSHPEPPG